MISDSLLFDAGSLFFAIWGLILAALSVTAFGRDLLPARTHVAPVRKTTTQSAQEHMKR